MPLDVNFDPDDALTDEEFHAQLEYVIPSNTKGKTNGRY
jgi:hypothetical protein